MSGDSSDSETDPHTRSRSLFRHVRSTWFGRTISRQRSASSIKQKPTQETVPTKTVKPNNKPSPAYSNRFPLINQRKYRRTMTINNKDDECCLIQTDVKNRLIPETKASSPTEEILPTATALEPLVFDLNPIDDEKSSTMQFNGSLETNIDDDGQQALIPDVSRTSSSSRISLNKFKGQLAQRARTALTKSSSLTSVVTNSSSSNQIEQVFLTEFFIERGKDLSIKDLNGTSDPYVRIFYGNEEKYITNTVTKNLNPIWNEKCQFFVHDLQTPIHFYVFDHDRIGRDESMGSAKLDLSLFPLDTFHSVSLELENERRYDGKTGTLKISLAITQKTIEFRDEVLRTLARQTVGKTTTNGRSTLNQTLNTTRRTIDLFIIEGQNIVSPSGNKFLTPFVRIKFANNKKNRTQPIKLTNGKPIWFQSFLFETMLADLPPVEFSVFDETYGSAEFIGRGLCHISGLEQEKTHRKTIELEDGCGMIDIFITITGTTPTYENINDNDSLASVALDVIPTKINEEDIERYKLASTLRSIKPLFDVGILEIKIYQARDLTAKDLGGKSDPFCIVELDSSRLRTQTIFKTLDPVWNKSFVIPVQDIHSVLQITVYDEDTNKTNEFIGKISIPLLSIQNGERKWLSLKDQKCLAPVKGAIEIEATLIYTKFKAVIRTFNPRETPYYQLDSKFSVGAIKQHVARIQNMLKGVINVFKFIDSCFQWESPSISFVVFMTSLLIVWNFELYMLPCILLLMFARSAVIEYRHDRLGKYYASLGDDTISAVVQVAPVDEDALDNETNSKEPKRSLLAMIQGVQDTVLEIQGYADTIASTLERIKNLFNFSVPWLSNLLIIILLLFAIILYYIPLRYLILAFVINKFTKRFRKPKGYIDNNEVVDFMSRLPSDPELMQYRELRPLSRFVMGKKNRRNITGSNTNNR